MDLKDHPTVKAYLKNENGHSNATKILESSRLKAIAEECGADDAGLVDIGRETMTPYLKDLLWTMPGVKTILVLAWGLNQAQLQSQAHSSDSETWISFLAKEKNLLVALATRKIRIKGSPLLMKKFAACFPS